MTFHFTIRRRICGLALLLVAASASLSIALSADSQGSDDSVNQVSETENQDAFFLPQHGIFSKIPTKASPKNSLDAGPLTHTPHTHPELNVLNDLRSALSTMQDQYFSLWLGKWTTSIDWTAAVMGTYVSATLSSLSRSMDCVMPGTLAKTKRLDVEAQIVESEIDKYFTQSLAYYFGEDHFAIRMQAFDDMLWVVLGWLESTQFIKSHSSTHYTPNELARQIHGKGNGFYASQFIPAFAHRARVFYELAEEGWDWRLCGGGMTWNPRLLPYKNAITNQLFISASVSMYLNFPGDNNCSPFLSQYDETKPETKELYDECDESFPGRYDPMYLTNAINGYDWLGNSGMQNDQGLYVDGFHISGYRQNHSKTTCDERNEMVYTYNQGVILSGLRGLWEATGNQTYLEDGHELIRNVLRATGWPQSSTAASASFPMQHQALNRGHIPAKYQDALPWDWYGLGSQGILTDLCDPSGSCSQDAQTFKGILFHHLTSFCTPLPTHAIRLGKTYAATREQAKIHQNSCDEYASWVVHNARAALRTRDSKGRFGSWWGAPSKTGYSSSNPPSSHHGYPPPREQASDLNDRGRGRTVETQGGGVAVVRAMYEFLQRAEGVVDLNTDLDFKPYPYSLRTVYTSDAKSGKEKKMVENMKQADWAMIIMLLLVLREEAFFITRL